MPMLLRPLLRLVVLLSTCWISLAVDPEVEKMLDTIHNITVQGMNTTCISQQYHSVALPVRYDHLESVRQKADMLARVLLDVGKLDNRDLLEMLILNLVKSDQVVEESRIMTFVDSSSSSGLSYSNVFMARVRQSNSTYREPQIELQAYGDLTTTSPISSASAASRSTSKQSTMTPHPPRAQREAPVPLTNLPWFADAFSTNDHRGKSPKFMDNSSNRTFEGWWTYPYFSCATGKWLLTYSIPLRDPPPKSPSANDQRLSGFLSFDVVVSGMDFNQCEHPPSWDMHSPPSSSSSQLSSFSGSQQPISYFNSTHKCHNETSTCQFERGRGWTRGGYTCVCRAGFYPRLKNSTHNGTRVEIAYWNKINSNDTVYDRLYQCLPCAQGCSHCVDDSPCLAHYDWSFRSVLLAISMLWILVTGVLMVAVYKYRRLKVLKVASPIFLCITLLGCAIMYAEMAAIFPYLNTPSCVATKWTRHLGFCLTYSSLLMKTWRVSLTYRVKSAHKLKLTDQQLLQWMFPILLVMLVYLGAWTVSAPPGTEEIELNDHHGKTTFVQCAYNWWDHSLAIGEVLFLIWGIKVCYSVRNAETLFNETKHISWAVYNIALVNIIMVSIHLLLLPNAGPDMKYLFGFIRTQLSTTVTIALVFGPKFYLVAKGLGDEHDSRARARGVTASFSINGISLANDEPPDLYRENEELKEELQKLAGQMEFMKIVHMGINNPHLKSKVSGYFHSSSANMHMHASPMPSRQSAGSGVGHPPSNNASGSAAVVHFEGDPHTLNLNLLNHSKTSPTPTSIPAPPPPAHIKLPSPVEEHLADDSPTAELLSERV